ncbi:MAG: DnaB-like helicase C-terminal domain-containing protein [Candidatus Helarchaeota archaeon]
METLAEEKAILFYLTEGLDSNLLKSELFSYEKNRLIFKEIKKRKKEGKPVDVISLIDALKGKVATSYLLSLDEGVVRGINKEKYFKHYVNQLIKICKEKEIKRLIGELIREPNFIDHLREILDSYELEDDLSIEETSFINNFENFLKHIELRRRNSVWGISINSFPKLNKALMGLREIIVLAAKPKSGKTTFSIQLASDALEVDSAVLYYDFENGVFNLMMKEICRKFYINYCRELLNSEISWTEIIQKIGDPIELKERYESFIIQSGISLSLEKIKRDIDQLRKKNKVEKVLVVIDSLQKLPLESLKDRRASIDDWLRKIEKLNANDPDLVFLLISELSREGQKPKESGDIEYSAHFLLKLDTALTENEIERFGDDGIRELKIEYARDVRSGVQIKYKVDFNFWRFEEL